MNNFGVKISQFKEFTLSVYSALNLLSHFYTLTVEKDQYQDQYQDQHRDQYQHQEQHQGQHR